jgi:hypothetical protein
MKTLKIVAVGEVKEAKDGRKYFACTFGGGFGLRNHTVNIFQQFVRNGKTNEPILDEAGKPLTRWDRGTPEMAKQAMLSGEAIDARIVTRTVVPYTIREGADPVRTYTTVVFGDQNEATVFASAGHPIVSEDGEILGASPKVQLATKQEESINVEF